MSRKVYVCTCQYAACPEFHPWDDENYDPDDEHDPDDDFEPEESLGDYTEGRYDDDGYLQK